MGRVGRDALHQSFQVEKRRKGKKKTRNPAKSGRRKGCISLTVAFRRQLCFTAA